MRKVDYLYISCWYNRGIPAVQKETFPFWHHWSESVWSQPVASSFLISQQRWAAVGKTSAVCESAHRSAIAHVASVSIVVSLGCASALQRSEWVLTLNLVDVCDAIMMTANLDESACLGVGTCNALLEWILCRTSFWQRIYLCVKILYTQINRSFHMERGFWAGTEMAETRREARRKWPHPTCWSLCVINEFVIPPWLAINDLTRRSAVIN